MNVWIAGLAVVIGYLLGALPFGVIVSRLSNGPDPREHGSGRTGTTNALRTLGMRGAAAVLVLDVAKGFVAVLLARWLLGDGDQVEWVAAAAGAAAVVGHIRSPFIGFRGGRGVAPATGALLAIAPWSLLVLAPVMALVVWRSRYVSLGSLTVAVLGPVVVLVLVLAGVAPAAAIAYAIAAGVLIALAHSDNIARLRAGTERRIGDSALPR